MDALKKSFLGASKGGDEVAERHERCEEMRETSLAKYSLRMPGSRVTFLVDIMEKMGCKMDSSFFSSVDCEGKINGGFHLDDEGKPGVVLCQNHIPDQEWMDRTMAHELVHAFDHCRNKIDWSNCEHHACTTNAASPTAAPVMKKRRVERRERLRKSAICKHFDKPGGCPFPDCKFAHGRTEIADAGKHSVVAQRKLIREQAVHRAEEQFQTAEAGAVTSTRRGTMIERYYTEMFSCDTMGKPLEDQYVHMHSNRLCVVGVAA
ncbi:hypothetical protein BBJ28_00015122, partial [Nothophytophthora sp. Chile5]